MPIAAAFTLAACASDRSPAGPRPVGALDAAVDPALDGGTTTPPESDLPCEVATLLATRCWTCHGPTPADGAPMSLITRAHLADVSHVEAESTFAERAVIRMRSDAMPMPPAGDRVPETEIAAVEAWITAGMPAGRCDVRDPYDTPVQCTSGRTWPESADEGPEMHPGRACISCHSMQVVDVPPELWVGGTVYPTAHEPDDCIGASGATSGAIVEITDATGRVFRLETNASGNFLLVDDDVPDDDFVAPFTSDFAYPYRARVLFEGRVRAMGAAQTTGDCNSCHTVEGANGAPGRILLP